MPKIGVQDRKKMIAAVALMAAAISVALYTSKGIFWGTDASAAPSTAASSPRPKPGSVVAAQDSSDPRLRTDFLDTSRKIKLEEGGRNIFTMEAAIPPIANSVRTRAPEGPPGPPDPTPKPTPPPIPIKYYGFANNSGDPRKIFLQQDGSGAGDVFVASLGDIVARRYRVVQIQPNSVTMEDVLTGNRQPIPLTVR